MKAKRLYSLFTLLLKRMLLAFCIFSILRIIYLGYNFRYFPTDWWNFSKSLVSGVLFDASTIAYVFLPFTLLSLLPFKFQLNARFKILQKALFLILIAICTIANIADTIYFKFAKKRSGVDVFSVLGDESNPVGNYFTTYWAWILVIIGLLLVTHFFYISGDPDLKKSKRKWWFYAVVALVVIMAGRGSFGLKPLKTFDAARFVNPEFVPLAVNTPFNLISSMQGSSLEKKKYFEDSIANELIPVEKYYFKKSKPTNQPNIVIIILESFSRDYCGWLRKKDLYTPFLDSFSTKCLNFPHAYANGGTSIQGLPAVLAGIPSFMEVPYINSSYSNNKINNLGFLLKKIGYESNFYHGADNGTLGFQNFLKITGWENYYGKKEYPNKVRDFDGSWGIFDGPYFQYIAKELSNKKNPFLASVFSLTSHDPYPLPKAYFGKYKEGKLPIHPTVQYTDEMLKLFFDSVKTKPWYKNTVFIITADHSSHSTEKYFYSWPGRYEIPLLIYNPSGVYVKPGNNYKTVNQIDILPSVLDIVNYPYPFFSLGTSVFDTGEGYAYHKSDGLYQVISYPYVAQMNYQGKFTFFKKFKENNDNFYDLFPEEYAIRKRMLKKLLAFIQLHNKNMIENSFYSNYEK